MHWYLDVLKKYAVFSGRASRQEFWMFTLFHLIICLILAFGGGALSETTKAVLWLYGLYLVATFLPALAVSVRRLHDVGKSGWWYLISFVPLIGSIWLLVLWVLDSKPGANQYGPNPKGVGSAPQVA